ncbi:MAG: o-succinylbenzoate synthase [Isosphaeraceae bacterium]|nr:o-succinylbenzoate synthase [Isosphaeraceae bacterium]
MTGTIKRVALTHIQIPLKEPFRISGGEVAIKDAISVALETDAAVGLGESAPMPASFGYSGDTPEGCWDDLCERIVPGLLGWSFGSIEEIAARAEKAGGSRFAVAGVETACWDLLAQSRHETIAELLGAAHSFVNHQIESGLAVGLYPTVVELLKTIETHLAEGYRRVKIKIAPGRDIELVRAVRQHFGDELPLMVDANGAYTREDIGLFRQLDALDLLMFEQPMAANDLDGLAALQAAVTTPVCLDETADTLEHTADALRRGAGRIVNIKIQRAGGFGPALAMHDLCQAHGAACWVGTMPELGIGQAQGIHLATLANCKYPTDIEPSARWFVDDYVVPRLELTGPGLFSVPTRPGLGFQVDPAKLRRYQVRQREFTTHTSA